MLKKQPVRIITLLSFIIAIVGIVNDLFYTTHSFSVMRIKDALNPLNLDFGFEGQSISYNGHNYVNAVFDVLLLLGAILYTTSKSTEFRLIRFVFSTILFSNVLLFVSVILLMIFNPQYLPYWIHHLPIRLFNYGMSIFWIYLSLGILKFFNQTVPIQLDEFEENGKEYVYLVKADSGKRFLNLLVDLIVSILIFYPMFEALIYTHPQYFASEAYMLLASSIRLIIYYSFYEAVLGATPGKLLTETRVTNEDGTQPSFGSIFIRTVSRLVPFEAFSFFANDGWHDKWSNTIVVKEEKPMME